MKEQPIATTLAPTDLIDSDHPEVVAFSRRSANGASERDKAVSLYYAVRDGFRYDPYRIDLAPAGMRASRVLETGMGWCVTKAGLLAAAARAAGIPARLGYADVRNHLSTERMRQVMQTDLFMWHGYTELWLEEAWVKATPAFNVELCERFRLLPIEWDGRTDSLYHPYDRTGRRHMEYVRQRGVFDDMPLAQIRSDFAAAYPRWLSPQLQDGDFDADVARETGRPEP
jgi:transglutaminase-like putative cysteine protease